MLDMFMKIHENEKNENTALILMLGELSGKLSRIIEILSQNNEKCKQMSKALESIEQDKNALEENKHYMPLSAEDYD
jgi:hypothetical protein